MLDQSTRVAILRLHSQGHGSRAIATALGVSRGSVRRVLHAGRAEIPESDRPQKAEPHRDQILQLFAACKGNLVRVHEELLAAGASLSYQALTAFCRRHDIGRPRPRLAGHYDFEPGQEMQHDTSPHDVRVGGRLRRAQTASLVLCHSRMRFLQLYPGFTRFTCKVFLTDALAYMGGSCTRCMIDNTHVVVLSGTGAQMVPSAEMEAFGERYGFAWQAHEKGDANRSAHVERGFDHFERNFLAGRSFSDWDDLNAQARAWCDRVNATVKRHLHASPRELLAAELPRMRPLPTYLPEVYLLHQRIVDSEGFVNVHRNRYTAPWTLVARFVEVRETKDRIQVFDGPRMVADHRKVIDRFDVRVIASEHRPPRHRAYFGRPQAHAERDRLLARLPALAPFVTLLAQRARAGLRELRILSRMADEYPLDALLGALGDATHFGLTDLDRIERMVLRRIASDFFPPPPADEDDDD
jgi:transposase